MNIKECTAYRVGEQVFQTIQEAQFQELSDLVGGDGTPNEVRSDVLREIILQTDEVVAILTCTPKSKPRKPRSDIGKKRAKKDSTPAVV